MGSKYKTSTEYDADGKMTKSGEERDETEVWWRSIFANDNITVAGTTACILGICLTLGAIATSCLDAERGQATEATEREKLAPAHVTAAFEACAKTCGAEGVREASLASCVCD